MATKSDPEAGRAFVAALLTLILVGAAGAGAYAMAEVNHRRFRLAASQGYLWIERGRFLPLGFEPFVADSDELREAYAAVPLPPTAELPPSEVLDDRVALDRTLFALLSGWARQDLDATDSAAVARCQVYLERMTHIPGLSEEQRNERARLGAELGYHHGLHLAAEAKDKLKEALLELDRAAALGGDTGRAAKKIADELRLFPGAVSPQGPRDQGGAAEPTLEPTPGTSEPGWRL